MKKILVLVSLMLGITFLTNCSKQTIDPKNINEVLNPSGVEEPGSYLYCVYPNPFTDYLWVDVGEEAGCLKNYILFDCYGQLLLNVDPGNCYAVMIDLRKYPSGLYTIRLITTKDTHDVSISKI